MVRTKSRSLGSRNGVDQNSHTAGSEVPDALRAGGETARGTGLLEPATISSPLRDPLDLGADPHRYPAPPPGARMLARDYRRLELPVFTQSISPPYDNTLGESDRTDKVSIAGGGGGYWITKTMSAQADVHGNFVLEANLSDGPPFERLDLRRLDGTGTDVGDWESRYAEVTKLIKIPSMSRAMKVDFAFDFEIPYAAKSLSPFQLLIAGGADVMVSTKFILDVVFFPNAPSHPARIEQEFFRADRFNDDPTPAIARAVSPAYEWDVSLMVPPGVNGLWVKVGTELLVQRLYHAPENATPFSSTVIHRGLVVDPTVRLNGIWVQGW